VKNLFIISLITKNIPSIKIKEIYDASKNSPENIEIKIDLAGLLEKSIFDF